MSQALLLSAGRRLVGFELGQLGEIVQDRRVQALPMAPPGFIGAVSVQGEVLPVIELATLLGEQPTVHDRRLVVVSAPQLAVALAVGAVHGLCSLTLAAHPLAGTLAGNWEGRVFPTTRGIAVLLDVARLRRSLDECLAAATWRGRA